MSICRVGLALSDSWDGLYLNGKLLLEGYNLSAENCLRVLSSTKTIDLSVTYIDENWLYDEQGKFLPEDFKKIKKAK